MTSLAGLVLALLVGGGDLEAAEQALADGRARDALEALGGLADGEDASLRALVVQGRAFFRLGEYQGAVEALLRAHDLAPEDEELARDATYACWYAAAGAGTYAPAYLADARRLSKRTGDPRLIADVHFAAGDYETALEHYRRVPDADETRLFVRERIALCLRALGRADEARAAYAQALDEALRAGDLQAAFRTAFAARQQGRFLAWLDGRLEEEPGDLEARRFRGYARAAVLRHEEAAADLRAVAAARPGDMDTRAQLCSVLLTLGARQQRPEAIREGVQLGFEVLEQRPDDRATWDRLVWAASYHWANRDVKRSHALLRELNRIDPTDFDTGLNLAAMARRLDRPEEAAAVLKRLLEVSPDDPDVLNDLAIVRDGEGDRVEAVRLWRRVLEVDEDNLNALENLLTAAWERGDVERARGLVERGLAASLRPDGPRQRWEWFRDRLGWCPKGFGR